MDNQSNYTGIVARLKNLQAKLAYLRAFQGLLTSIGIAVLLFGILIGITSITWLDIPIRIIVDIVLAIGLVAIIYFLCIRPLINRIGLLPIARTLEKKYGQFQSRLIAALELYDKAKENRENYSIELIEKTIEEAGGVVGEIDTDAAINYKPLKGTSIKIGILVMAAVAGIIINPPLVGRTWQLYSNPASDFSKPPAFSLKITPSGGEYYRNKDLAVLAIPEGIPPRNIDINFKFEDGEWASEPMNKPQNDTAQSFAYTFKNIKRSVDVYARSGNIESQKMHYEIVDPPRLIDLKLLMDYPSYSRLPSSNGAPNDGNVAALKGTAVSIAAKANKPLSGSYLLFSDSTKINLKTDGDLISGKFSVKNSMRYTIAMRDQANRENPEPIWYDIQPLDDYPPSIEVVFPGVDVDLNDQMAVPLNIAISDDYGFDKLNLVWWLMSQGQQGQPSKINIRLDDLKTLQQLISHKWDVSNLGMEPGDLLYYYCEVSDNDAISGPKWSKSKTYAARLPSLDEILADVGDAGEHQVEKLEEVLKNQKELQEQINDIAREMMKANDVSWEQQQKASKALEKQKELAKELSNLADQMQDNLNKLEENNLVGEQIAEKMQEIQKLMDEVAPPELKDAMKKLEEALKNMNPEDMKKALDQMNMSTEQLLENLDRTLALLQKLAVEQKLDMLAQMADQLVQDQNKINENVDKASDSLSLCKQSGPQKNNSDNFDLLKKQFNDLKQMDDTTRMIPPQEKEEANQQVNNPEIPQDFKQNQESMCKNSQGACQNKGKKLAGNLSKMAESLKKAQKAMQEQQKADITKKLDRAAEDLLYVSGRQEILLDTTRAYAQTGDQLRKIAGDQIQLTAASSRVADAISEISKETIFINISLMKMLGQVLAGMNDASNKLDGRMSQAAIQSEQGAMASLNLAVMMILQARNNASNSSSGSGMQEMMKQLQQMSQSQSSLNQETMNIMPKPGMRLSYSQQQSMQRLAGQQEMLRRQLEQMNDQFGKRGEMLGRLDQLGEEMKKVAEDLAKSNVDQKTIERQQQILNKLLDTQKSVNQRDYSQKRKAEEGFDVARKSPNLPDENTIGKSWLSNAAKKALEERYPRQYEKLIKAYFKSFQGQENTSEK